jgi:hypothetical protein
MAVACEGQRVAGLNGAERDRRAQVQARRQIDLIIDAEHARDRVAVDRLDGLHEIGHRRHVVNRSIVRLPVPVSMMMSCPWNAPSRTTLPDPETLMPALIVVWIVTLPGPEILRTLVSMACVKGPSISAPDYADSKDIAGQGTDFHHRLAVPNSNAYLGPPFFATN